MKENRRPEEKTCKGANVRGTYRVTGDGHQGIGLSGVSYSDFGSRLQVPAAEGRDADTCVADARGRHPSPARMGLGFLR